MQVRFHTMDLAYLRAHVVDSPTVLMSAGGIAATVRALAMPASKRKAEAAAAAATGSSRAGGKRKASSASPGGRASKSRRGAPALRAGPGGDQEPASAS